MGADLYLEQRLVNRNRGLLYVKLKQAICKELGLKWEPDKRFPGDDQGVTDEELLKELKKHLAPKPKRVRVRKATVRKTGK